ncbi:MAG: hypothetical protein K9N51_03845 [Candidatus Pacebacteria bacterium]|nr:hypothetical protein [Candidatus Paceibacterota bacterium]
MIKLRPAPDRLGRRGQLCNHESNYYYTTAGTGPQWERNSPKEAIESEADKRLGLRFP